MAAPRHQDRRPPRGPRARSFLWLATVLIVVAYGTLVGTGQPPSASADSGGPRDGSERHDEAECNDTWAWDGTTWPEPRPAHTPSARQGAAMAYDAAHQQIVLFGGSNNASGGLGDTWTWDGSDWTEQSPAH